MNVKLKYIDWLGVILELYLCRVVVVSFSVVFGLNYLLGEMGSSYYQQFLRDLLILWYKSIFDPNIDTVTTLASVFIGIYFTVLSILGSLKLNSVLSVIGEKHLLKLIIYLKRAMTASFLLLFYSLIIPIVESDFLKAFLFFIIFLYMTMTAVRFGANIFAIYERDFVKLNDNIEEERNEREKMMRTLNKLDIFLQEYEVERNILKSTEFSSQLEKKQKEREKR